MILNRTKLVMRPTSVRGRMRWKRPSGGARQIGFIRTPYSNAAPASNPAFLVNNTLVALELDCEFHDVLDIFGLGGRARLQLALIVAVQFELGSRFEDFLPLADIAA